MSLMRIDQLFNFEKGVLQSSKCTPGDFNFITASSEWKTHNEYTHNCEALVFAAAASGSLGRTHYVNGKFVTSDLCFVVTEKDPEQYPVDLEFYHIIFNQLKDDIVKNTKAGTSKEAIGLKAFGQYRIPYFPIKQQIETKSKFRDIQQTTFDVSNELFHQLDLIKQLRQAFLKEAMRGKIVKSITITETAQELLAKIKAEKQNLIKEKKIKKEKELPPVKEEEIPFKIPKHWVWCRLGEIAYITSGSTPAKDAFVESGIPYLKMYNLRNQKIDFAFKKQYIKEEVHNGQLKRCRAFSGDILMNIVGPPLGKIAIIPDDLPECNFNQAAVVIRPMIKRMNSFIFWYLNEMSEINSIDTKGVAGQSNISVTQAHNMKIPLPPLHDQELIIKGLVDLVAYADGIEKRIKEGLNYNDMLLQQVLREALIPKEKAVEDLDVLFADKDYQIHLAMLHKLIRDELGINYGEVATQKTVFHLNTFTSEKIPYPFVNSNYGTYSHQLKHDLQKNKFLAKAKVNGREVFKVESSKEKEVLDSLTKPENKSFVEAVKEVLAIYRLPFINKETDKIELLNTVSKLILDLKSVDADVIYQGMKSWKIKQADFKYKADKFSLTDTKGMIRLIKSTGLEGKLMS